MSDDRAFEQFYRDHEAYVRALCAARCRSSGDVADAESVVWFDAYQSFERFRGEEPRKLLYRLVTWRVRNLYRSGAKKYEREVEDEKLMGLLEKQAQAHLSMEQRLFLEQALSHESALDRALLFGRFVEELTWEELAVRHELHRNTARNRCEQSLQRLRATLNQKGS